MGTEKGLESDENSAFQETRLKWGVSLLLPSPWEGKQPAELLMLLQAELDLGGLGALESKD